MFLGRNFDILQAAIKVFLFVFFFFFGGGLGGGGGGKLVSYLLGLRIFKQGKPKSSGTAEFEFNFLH